MPAGKLGSSGSYAFVRRPPYSVNIRSLRCLAKPTTPQLTVTELREIRQRLRRSIQAYRISAIENAQTTATERRKALGKIRQLSEAFLKTGQRKRAGEMLDLLNTVDVDTRKILMRQVQLSGSNWRHITKTLPLVVAVSSLSPDACFPGVTALAEMDVGFLVPRSGRWPDPALANLVAAVEPIWRRVTGRTPARVSTNREGDEQTCPFARWLGQMIERVGGIPPAEGRVVKIVRSLNADREALGL